MSFVAPSSGVRLRKRPGVVCGPRQSLRIARSVATMASVRVSAAAADSSAPDKIEGVKNRLGNEKSPYLLQHQYNPVDWYPWGEEAFQKAKDEDKPIFLSVGYSTCHWCHVMEHESFENEEVAALLNENFVPVKLDREERPDIDAVYMTYIQAISGSGGWPMSVFMTPDLKPIVGATYLPLERFKFALQDISNKWNTIRSQYIEESDRIVGALQRYIAQPRGDSSVPVTADALEQACASAAQVYDKEWGGFGEAPKFPRPSVLEMLFYAYSRDPEGALGVRSRHMALFTLQNIAMGGIHDHLGGGFHRYSVDDFWHVPHFEKMSYDQSQLAMAYLAAYQVTPKQQFEAAARGVLDYVARDLRDPETCGFYSAEDADSEVAFSGLQDAPVKAEGAFYVWTQFELTLVLGKPAADMFSNYFSVRPEGNAPEGSDPNNELEGKNVLKISKSLEEVADASGVSQAEAEQVIASAKSKLFEQRKSRPSPHLDDKILTSWNGLMVSAFARGSCVFESDEYASIAVGAAEFLYKVMWNGTHLFRSYREGLSTIHGFAEDYANSIGGFLDVYELTGDSDWIRRALELQKQLDAKFWDEDGGGYFSTAVDEPTVLLRKKEDYDGAEPTPSTISTLNLLKLSSITGDEKLYERAVLCAAGFSLVLEKSAFAMPVLAAAVVSLLDGQRRVVLSGDPDAASTKDMKRAFYTAYMPHVALVCVGPDGSGDDAALLGEETRSMAARDGLATAYVCRGKTCMEPVNDVDQFRAQLQLLRAPAPSP